MAKRGSDIYNISKKKWTRYISLLRDMEDSAANDMLEFMARPEIKRLTGRAYSEALIDYGYYLATKYGEGATAIASSWYDAIVAIEGVDLLPAVPAKTATYSEVARSVGGAMSISENPSMVANSVGRLVKLAGVDTTMQNALRDGAEWAWIPQGDTCAFCLTLASMGWMPASEDALKGGHAEHIHANCDCTYAIRHNGEVNVDVDGYDPDELYDEYMEAGDTRSERINALARQHYSRNRKEINAQKRAAYAARKESEAAES